MARMLLRNFTTSVALTVLWLANLMVAEGQPRLRYAVIYADPEGRTHFRDEFFPWEKAQSSDSKTPVMQTPFVDAQKLGFLTLPRGFRSEWHPAPGKRFVVVLSGLAELARRFPLAEARQAQELLGKGGVTGKIVLVCGDQ